jgi:AcrR family transcriptional regulator
MAEASDHSVTGRNGKARSAPVGPPADSEVARRRREQILEAAEAIITSEGLPRLSLGRIERRTGMSRGQLTYYFPTKEAILLAVFDRMLARMIAEAIAAAEREGAPKPGTGSAWECLQHGFQSLAQDRRKPDGNLLALVHTFMAQVGHREDFRRKLAAANANWRAHLTADFAAADPPPALPPEVLASLVMALFQGLTDQLTVDPDAFDRTRMAEACLTLLAPLFGRPTPTPGASHE